MLANLETKLGDDEKNVHEMRVGFSTDDSDMQLGESVNSFAYGGSAKKGLKPHKIILTDIKIKLLLLFKK